MAAHARLSPSSASRWTQCTASPAASDGLPNVGNDASRQGTCCHQIQEEMLLHPERDLLSYLGRVMVFGPNGEFWADETAMIAGTVGAPTVEVTDEMLDAVASALAYINQMLEMHGGELLVEQRVPIGQFTGEPDAFGSADVIIL